MHNCQQQQQEQPSLLLECATLYQQAAMNQTSQALTTLEKITSLYRAAQIQTQLQNTNQTKQILNAALQITPKQKDRDDNNTIQQLEKLYASVLEMLAEILLAQSSKQQQDAKQLLDVCHQVDARRLCPDEPVLDEYRGAALRIFHGTKQLHKNKHANVLNPNAKIAAKQVYEAFDKAARKSYKAFVSMCSPTDSKNNDRITNPKVLAAFQQNPTYARQIVERLLRHSVLAVSSAREAGIEEQRSIHLQYAIELIDALHRNNIQIDPQIQAEVFIQKGIQHKENHGQTLKAKEHFRRALEINPQDGHAMVHLASLQDETVKNVQQIEQSYVAGLFDGYAARFEQELLQDLQYQGHILVANALNVHMNWRDSLASKRNIAIIDLGCGTGLLGELIRKQTREAAATDSSWDSTIGATVLPIRITGVDLSQQMIQIARARVLAANRQNDKPTRVYDQTELSDGVRYLETLPGNSVDVITASDVFIYVGALDDMFRACERVLTEGGLLVFTVELPAEETLTVQLLKSGRFGHSVQHVKQLAQVFGFKVQAIDEVVLRIQSGKPVAGAVVTLKL